jgi:beta-barrel assembly-enhancing protease
MKSKLRLVAVLLLMTIGSVFSVAILKEGVKNPTGPTLAPAFQLLGTIPKHADRMVGRLLPINEIDEGKLGNILAARYQRQANIHDPAYIYINDLLTNLGKYTNRKLNYRAFILNSTSPNAMALPGGVVLITRGLLTALRSEAELVAVLAHEIGHIEQGHCFDGVKFELLARKIGAPTLGKIADFTTSLLLRHSFSKTQEHESDEYSYTLLLNSPYDPRGTGMAFASLQNRHPSSKKSLQPFRDYFSSHPPLALRSAAYTERAINWWRRNPGERRYVGKQNLKEQKSYFLPVQYAGEWIKNPR